MMRSPSLLLYDKCLSYSRRRDRTAYEDIVHDAFLTWFDKTGRNLFEEPEITALSVVKKTWQGKYWQRTKITVGGRMGRYGWKGELVKRQFINADKVLMVNRVTPEDEYIAQELHELFMSMDSELRLQIYLYAVEGFSQTEIAKMLNQSKSFINYYFKKMRYMAAIWN